jgi:hypothetical protein
VGKLLPEEEPGAMDPGFDGCDGQPKGSRDLLVRELFHVVKQDDDPILFGEAAEAPLDGGSGLSGDSGIIQLTRPIHHGLDIASFVVEDRKKGFQ